MSREKERENRPQFFGNNFLVIDNLGDGIPNLVFSENNLEATIAKHAPPGSTNCRPKSIFLSSNLGDLLRVTLATGVYRRVVIPATETTEEEVLWDVTCYLRNVVGFSDRGMDPCYKVVARLDPLEWLVRSLYPATSRFF